MSTPPDVTAIGLWIVGASTVVGAIVGLWRVGRAAWQAARKLGHFLDDWFGEDSRPGVPGRPGFPERLGRVEDQVTSLSREVSEVRQTVSNISRELHPNGGSSMRDAIDRMHIRLADDK